MAKKSHVLLATASAVTLLLTAVGCSSGESSNPSDESGNTVPIDVGNDLTVDLTKDTLNVAVFVPGVANQYGQVMEQSAKDTADELGIEMTLYDAGYDANQQLNQMQTALQSGDFDAAVVHPVDGTVICKITTEDYPEANILVSNNINPVCDYGTDQVGESPDELWAPGTLNFVGSNNYMGYIDGWFTAAAEANPGAQNVLAVLGPATAGQTRVIEVALDKFKKANPEYTVDTVYTEYTSEDAFTKTQSYLQGNPDTSLILSIYTPDISQGIVNAVDDAGLLGEINIVDQGFGDFSLDQIEEGNIQFSMLFFPANAMKLSLETLVAAQSGDAGTRFVDDSVVGTVLEPFAVNKDSINELPAELR